MATKKSNKSDNTKKKIIELLKKNLGNVSKTCEAANIHRSTFYEYVNKDSDFKQKVEDVKEACIDLAESELLKLIQSGNPTSIIFYLKTKGKKRGYVEKVEQEHSGNIQVIDFSN